MRTLYLCYFGIDQPLVQTQVLPYLRELRIGGIEPTLLTFEPDTGAKWRLERAAPLSAAFAAEGIRWSWIRYHRRPTVLAKSYDIVSGARRAIGLVRRDGCQIVHARGQVAAAIAALAKRVTGTPLLFDVRGLLADEYVEAGYWARDGYLFHITKRVERALVDAADGFVVLTSHAREAIFPGDPDGDGTRGRPIEVIPCCVDLDRFTPVDAARRAGAKADLGLAGRRVLIHAGGLDGWNDTGLIASVIAAASRDPGVFVWILTQSKSDRLIAGLRRLGVSDRSYAVASVPASEVPRYLRAADAGLALYRRSGSKVASSPTRVAEYLASGIPVVYSTGLGDLDEVLAPRRVGIGLDRSAPESIEAALADLEALGRDPDLPRRCRQCAEEEFDLHRIGGVRYRRLYARMGARQAR